MSPRPNPLIIPIFINHQGCPHRCVFCNQDPITGAPRPAADGAEVEAVGAIINAWLGRPVRPRPVEVAFYGGSFTGLPLEQQCKYLSAVQPFIKSGKVDSIRLSTRPDYIHPETAGFLKDFGVATIEIGVQSMDQEVLDRSLRGHTVTQTEQALAFVKLQGLTVGAQIMIGLPGDTTAKSIAGIERLARLQPDFVRIYPVLVIKSSGLEKLYRNGLYQPLPIARAVILAGRLTRILGDQQIPVIRTGLQSSPELEAGFLAGPYHPAFGEFVKAWLLFDQIRRQLSCHRHQPCQLILSPRDRSLLTGHGGKLLRRLRRHGFSDQGKITFQDVGIEKGKFLLERMR